MNIKKHKMKTKFKRKLKKFNGLLTETMLFKIISLT